jgi:hypothetical protein
VCKGGREFLALKYNDWDRGVLCLRRIFRPPLSLHCTALGDGRSEHYIQEVNRTYEQDKEQILPDEACGVWIQGGFVGHPFALSPSLIHHLNPHPPIPFQTPSQHPHIIPTSSTEETPILNLKRLQNPLRHCLPLFHKLRLLTRTTSLHVLARIMRHVDRDDNVGALLLQAQKEKVDGHEFGLLAPRVGLGCLDKVEGVDGLVAMGGLVGG